MNANLPLAAALTAVLVGAVTLSAPARADGHHHRHWNYISAEVRHAPAHYRTDHRGHGRHYYSRDYPRYRHRGHWRHGYGHAHFWRGGYYRYHGQRVYYRRYIGPNWYYSGPRVIIDYRGNEALRAAVAAGLIVDLLSNQ